MNLRSCLTNFNWSRIRVKLRPTVSRPVCLGVKRPCEAQNLTLITVRQLRVCWCRTPSPSVVHNCYWHSPVQSFSGQSLAGLMTTFYCLRFETPANLEVRCVYTYIPQEQGSPVIPPGTGYPLHCLLRHTGLRWKYSNTPSRGVKGFHSVR
jgi:hypothetical protein